jgi:ABC-type Mn2+/Zn2+ transport system ATPase subunit
VTNFRSVEDSGEFSVEQVTCLVSKNEAGKSAVLLALGALHPHPSTPLVFDKERDYPRRHLTAYAARHAGGEATTVTTVWQLRHCQSFCASQENGRKKAPRKCGVSFYLPPGVPLLVDGEVFIPPIEFPEVP